MSDEMEPPLIQFLRARFDEEQSTAEKATPGRWKLWGMTVMADTAGDNNVDHATSVAQTFSYDGGGHPRTFDADHIALHDPARVLAEVKAKRWIIDHEDSYDGWDMWVGCVFALAQPYADHPDFDPQWLDDQVRS